MLKILHRNKPSSDGAKQSTIFKTLQTKLQQTSQHLAQLFKSKSPIDPNTLTTIETQLLLTDIGISACNTIMTKLKQELLTHNNCDLAYALTIVQQTIVDMLLPYQQPLNNNIVLAPKLILMVGVNGAGKTTTIGKLAHWLKNQGQTVMLAAGDTFRAAATEQLQIWGKRNAISVIAQQPGADPAAVIFDAFSAAKARNIDVLLADTSGRLHTQQNLMAELQKIKRVIQKLDPQAPHETLLVIDGTVGQNALNQAKEFHDAIGLTGLIVTKLDGTAKGGIVVALTQQLALPIKFIGFGEKVDNLCPFVADDFVRALLN